MKYSALTCTEFVEVLASKAPVPGGGGASALVGAIGTALCNMVGSLTVGKKKYAEVEAEITELMERISPYFVTTPQAFLVVILESAVFLTLIALAYKRQSC